MTKVYESVVFRLALMMQGVAAPSLKREEGQTLAEYALILAGIAILVIGAIAFLKGSITNAFSQIGSAV